MRFTRIFLVLFCTICFTPNIEGARILGLFPLQTKSHFVMFEAMMKTLADAGHQVDIVSHFPLKTSYPNYTDIVNLSGTLPPLVNNFNYEFLKVVIGSDARTATKLLGSDVCDLLELPGLQNLIKNPPNDPPYDLVLSEFFLASCYFAFARHLNVPLVAASSSPVMPHANDPLGNPMSTDIIAEDPKYQRVPMNFWQRLRNTLRARYNVIETRYYARDQDAIIKKHFGPEMPGIDELERDVSLLLTNSHHILHGVRPFTPTIVEVPGLHLRNDETPAPAELKKWMDDSNDGFFYFSFGSMVMLETFPKSDLAEIYKALNEVAPIRILLKVARPELLPPGLPKNVRNMTWVPQIQVLKHKNIKGFITHGGLMGIQEALKFAVPLIGFPLFGDQRSNLQVVSDRESGLILDYTNIKADKIVAAINALAYNPKYKKNMITISSIFMDRLMSPQETTVFWIEYILKYGPGVLRSPAIYLTWWQTTLLDVHATIFVAVLLTLYIVKLILSAFINRILRIIMRPSLSMKKNK